MRRSASVTTSGRKPSSDCICSISLSSRPRKRSVDMFASSAIRRKCARAVVYDSPVTPARARTSRLNRFLTVIGLPAAGSIPQRSPPEVVDL